MKKLKLNGMEIRTMNGMYCLSDIWEADGGRASYRPNKFMHKRRIGGAYMKENKNSFMFTGGGPARKRWGDEKLTILYAKSLKSDVGEAIIKKLGDFVYTGYELKEIAGLSLSTKGGMLSLTDLIRRTPKLNSSTIGDFKRQGAVGWRYIQRAIADGREPIVVDAVSAHSHTWVEPGLFVLYCKKYLPEIACEVAEELCEVSNEIMRREFTFGQDIVYNLFSGYEIINQFEVLGGRYYIDWYIPELKLAVEFDEAHHDAKPETREADMRRQIEIEQLLGCRFIRYTDK